MGESAERESEKEKREEEVGEGRRDWGKQGQRRRTSAGMQVKCRMRRRCNSALLIVSDKYYTYIYILKHISDYKKISLLFNTNTRLVCLVLIL